MKNILLQHWSGELNELVERSTANIKRYVESVGADYEFLRGELFDKRMTPPCQKMHMLNECFDEYDMVVMVDADMFARKGMTENVFTDPTGIGRHTEIQTKLRADMARKFPKLCNVQYPYWGGSIWRLPRELRQRFRSHINKDELLKFSGNYEDEGMMHRLAILSDLKQTPEVYLPGNHWNRGNFEDGVEEAAFIHIRFKVTPYGPKRAKIENYKDLVQRGLIEE